MDDDVVIQTDTEKIYLKDLSCRVINFDASTSNQVHEITQVGTLGADRTSSKVGELTINLSFDIFADNKLDYEAIVLRLMGIFSNPKPFYIYSTRTPYIRWQVVVQGSVSIQRYENSDIVSNDVSVTMVCPSGYAESVGTTKDSLDFNSGVWGIGQNLLTSEQPKYNFTNETNIRFFNASNIPLTAGERPVAIVFHGDVDKTLVIKNKTTNQELDINKKLTQSDELTIIGLVPYLAGKQCYADTNHGYLDYAVGWNDLEISGTTNFDISFDTKFYY